MIRSPFAFQKLQSAASPKLRAWIDRSAPEVHRVLHRHFTGASTQAYLQAVDRELEQYAETESRQGVPPKWISRPYRKEGEASGWPILQAEGWTATANGYIPPRARVEALIRAHRRALVGKGTFPVPAVADPKALTLPAAVFTRVGTELWVVPLVKSTIKSQTPLAPVPVAYAYRVPGHIQLPEHYQEAAPRDWMIDVVKVPLSGWGQFQDFQVGATTATTALSNIVDKDNRYGLHGVSTINYGHGKAWMTATDGNALWALEAPRAAEGVDGVLWSLSFFGAPAWSAGRIAQGGLNISASLVAPVASFPDVLQVVPAVNYEAFTVTTSKKETKALLAALNSKSILRLSLAGAEVVRNVPADRRQLVAPLGDVVVHDEAADSSIFAGSVAAPALRFLLSVSPGPFIWRCSRRAVNPMRLDTQGAMVILMPLRPN